MAFDNNLYRKYKYFTVIGNINKYLYRKYKYFTVIEISN